MTSERLFDPCRQGYHDNCVAVDRGDRCTCGCHAGSAEVIALVTELSMTQAKLAATEADLAAAQEQLAAGAEREARLDLALENILMNVRGLSDGMVPNMGPDALWYFKMIRGVAESALHPPAAAVAEGTGRDGNE